MSDITNTSPIVTENKLKDFYEDIKPFLGCPAYVTQEGNSDYYSTDEKVIGRWTDGKPLYQKSYIITRSSTGNISASLDITNLEKIYNITGAIRDNNNNTIDIGYCNQENIWIDSTVIHIDTGSSLGTYYITLQYTKTTDSAVTTIEQKPTHYSTDEQVVGTWINGKPIYQKTFSTTVPNASANGSYAYKTIDHNIQNLDEYCEIKGVITSNEFSSVLPFFTDGGNKTKFNINTTQISIANDAAYCNGRTLNITIQYTKTTD